MGSIFYRGAFPFLQANSFSRAIQFTEDRSDAARHVVYVSIAEVSGRRINLPVCLLVSHPSNQAWYGENCSGGYFLQILGI